MLKVKNSLLAKISAIVLVVALVLGTVPTGLLRVNAADTGVGSVSAIDEVGGEVDSTDPTNIQVKYEGEIVIARLGADEEKGRETEGWYVGALMTVPSGIDYDFVQYTNGDEVTSSLASLGDVESFYMWQSVKKSDYDAAAGGALTYTWEFDWNTQADDSKQYVVFSIDTSKVTLSDEDKVAPTINTPVVNPSTWTNGDVEVSGTVNDNFSGVKAVYYKKVGTEETQTATLTGNTYSFTIGAESYEGEYVVWCEDNKGNKSDEVIASVKMDNEKCVVATGKASCGEWTSQGVTISGTVTDMTSGVASVSWRKTDESANGEATFNVDSYSFDVPAQDYKGDYIITCKDKAGNESLEFTVPVQMDITAPVIQEPAATPDTWTNGQVVIRGEVSDNLSGVASVIYRKANSTEEKVATLDASAKTYTITLEADDYEGNYVIYCEDNAGIKSTEKEVFVRMDNIAPSDTTVELGNSVWKKIVDVLTFKLFFNNEQKLTVNTKDNRSGIKTIEWTEINVAGVTTLTEDSVEKTIGWTSIYNGDVKKLEGKAETKIPSTPDKNVVVCVRVTDFAGNMSYVTTDGLIFDTTVPAPALKDNKLVLPELEATESVLVSGRPLYGIEEVGEDGQVIFDVKVTEATVDGILQSGIQSVTYEIKAKDRAVDTDYKATETGELYAWNQEEALKTVYDSTTNADAKISVDATKFNYNYVDLTVKVVDNAGNKTTETYEFAIDITTPTISIEDPDKLEPVGFEGADGRKYFDQDRTLVVTYTERSENWNQDVAEKELKDLDNGELKYVISWTNENADTTSDEDKHIATITFEQNIHYNVAKPVYKDAAGNVAGEPTIAPETAEPYVFSIDKFDYAKDSVAEITIKEETWLNELLNTITFGVFDLFSNEDTKVTVEVKDDFAGIKEIKYIEKTYTAGEYKHTLPEAEVRGYSEWNDKKVVSIISKEEDRILKETLEETIEKTLDGEDTNKNVVVFVNVIDYAGHDKILSSDGVIIDTTDPKGELTEANKMLLPTEDEQTKHRVPNTDKPLYGLEEVGTDKLVTFDINISERSLETTVQEETENTEAVKDKILQSGIKKVSYKVEAKDRNTDEYAITQGAVHEEATIKNGGLLYQWDPKTEKTVKTDFVNTIDVDAKVNNFNYVKVTVTVEDNAGNILSETYELAIDITAPTVSIDYVDEDADTKAKDVFENGENTIYGCYTNARQAKITYTERTENWNRPSNTEIVTALDITGTEMEHGVAYEIDWDDQEGSTSDDDTHVATVTFHAEKDDTTKYKDARYDINTTCKDAAGNASLETITDEQDEYPFHFIIDTVNPEVVEIEYSSYISIWETVISKLTFKAYNNNVNVTVKMKDMTSGVKLFDYEGLLDSNISNKNKEVFKTIVETQEITALTEEGTTAQLTGEFEVNFSIPEEPLTELNSFRGTVKVNAFDYCGNSTEVHDATRLVVDKIAPKGEVTFDAPVKEADGVSYYDGNFTATIVIDEANFYAEDVDIRVNDTRVYPSDWTQNGDVWTSHVSFTEENDYVLKVNYTDRSGNVMTPYESNQKTLDTTEPVITVTNLNHESANNDETIGFILTVTDKNMALADVKPQVTAVIRKGDNSSNYTYETITIDLGTPTVSTNANGETVYTYVVNNLEIDGYYSIVCTATDHANHTVSNIGVSGENGQSSAVETMNFSVNREGSVFWIETEHTDKYTDETFKDELDGAYANDQVTVKLHEINVDKVDDSVADDKRTVFTLNDGSESNTIKLVEKVNGTGNYERNVELGQGGWYKTTYTLDNDQFKNDGTYSLNIITYDKAENSNVNTKSEEGTIKFVVDRTNPVISSNVKNEQSIKENEYTVEFKIADVNLDPTTVVVKLDGKEIKCKEVGTGTYQFTLDEAQWANFPRLSQNFEIEAKDLAGNSAEIYEREDITVTDDVFIQAAAYMINHPLLLGISAAGLVAVIGFFIFFIILKRRKEERE